MYRCAFQLKAGPTEYYNTYFVISFRSRAILHRLAMCNIGETPVLGCGKFSFFLAFAEGIIGLETILPPSCDPPLESALHHTFVTNLMHQD